MSIYPQMRRYCLRLLCAALFLTTISAHLLAQTPISSINWDGSPASAAGPSGFTTLPATVIPGVATVAVSQWDRGAVAMNAAAGCYNSNNWQVGGTLATAQAANKCVFFTITNSATTQLRVTRLFIRSQVSATGPQSVQMTCTIGTTTTLFGTTFATIHTATPENWDMTGDVCIGPGQTATFRLYGWGATGTAGTLRINNLTSINAEFAGPVTATASSNSPVCAGTNLFLTGTAGGGIPGYTYSWAGPDGFTSAILSPTVTAIPVTGAGVYTLTVTDAMNCNTSSVPVTTTVAVNTSPSPITGTATVCPLLTTTLNSASASGTWSSSNTAIATVGAATGVVTGVAPGTVTITYQLSSSCFTTTIVTVNTPPTALSGSLATCVGTSTLLSSTPTGGTWISSNTTVATVSGVGSVTGVTVGTTDITYTAPSTGCITISTVTVYPLPAAITGTPTVCIGATTTLSSASAGGSWSSGNTGIATVGASTGVVTGVSAGTALISYMLGGTCAVTATVTVNPLPTAITGSLTVCEGSISALSSSPSGGTWSSSTPATGSVGSATGVFTGVSAGTTTITYTIPSTCYITAEATVNAIPAPITGPSGVCLGTTVTLNNVTAGGTWQSNNPTTASVTSGTGVVTGNAIGTARISYIHTATGCFVTRIQTVYPLPSAITGPVRVCPAQTITLSSAPGGGNWTSSAPAIATVGAGTGVVTGVSPGITTITYTLSTGCIATHMVSVDPAPPATITALGDTTFCPGDFVVLSANTGTALTYQWYSGATPIGGATSATYTATGTANYSVRVTNSLGCPWRSVPMAVLVNTFTATVSVPGGSTSACASTPIVLNASPSGAGYSWQWLHNGIPVPGAASSTYATNISGDYSVLMTNVTGCSDESGIVTLTILPAPDPTVTASGPVSFCAGGSVTLTAESGTGYTYQWSDGAGPIPGATNVSHTTGATGTYFATVTNASGCSTITSVTNVTSNPLPYAGISPVGPTAVCAGTTVTLNAITGGTYSYQWYKNGTMISGATGSSLYVTTTGGYRVRVVNTTTGCTNITAADTMVIVVSSPSVLALTPVKFCWGGSSLLSTNVSAAGSAISYQWFRDGAAIPGATSPTYSANETGSYACNISVPGSCTALTTAVNVSEMPLPNPVITQYGSMLKTANYYVAWQWYKNLAAIPGATGAETPHTGTGNYKVHVTDTNGCQSTSDVFAVSGGATTGIQSSLNEAGINIYPNPAHDRVYIQCNTDVTVIVNGIDGRYISTEKHAREVNIADVPAGIYLISVYNNEGVLLGVSRITKE